MAADREAFEDLPGFLMVVHLMAVDGEWFGINPSGVEELPAPILLILSNQGDFPD